MIWLELEHSDKLFYSLTFDIKYYYTRTSIAAQKIVDERHGPFKTTNISSSTRKARDFDHFYLASSSFKGKDEGCVNSFKAMRYYQNEGAKLRDEILKDLSE